MTDLPVLTLALLLYYFVVGIGLLNLFHLKSKIKMFNCCCLALPEHGYVPVFFMAFLQPKKMGLDFAPLHMRNWES